MRIGIVVIAVLIGFSLWTSAIAANIDSTDIDTSHWQILAYPWVSINSDEGLSVGFSAGIAQPPGIVLFPTVSVASVGKASIGIRGEIISGRWHGMGETTLFRSVRFLYPAGEGIPDYYASATVDRFYSSLSILRSTASGIEIGPDLLIDIAKGKDAEDFDDQPLDIDTLARFGFGSIVQAGIRARWYNTSPIRPMDGWLVEGAIRAGRASGDANAGVCLDAAADWKIAWTKPISERTRIYLRGWGRHQWNSPPPVRNDIGWVRSVRGQPFHRDFGRRFISGRTQIHRTVLTGWGLPFRIAHSIWSKIPSYRLDVEMVGFYDVGVVGDPDFGWKKTRHGYGVGLRFILPPELVFMLDFGITPGGDIRFYLGGGETL